MPDEPSPDAASPASAPAAASQTPQVSFLDRLPAWTVPAILLGVPLLFTLIARLSPWFYDHIVWQDYWGPIKADAENFETLSYHGIAAHSGYNVVNTLSWAALLGVCILGLAQMLRHFRAPMDPALIVGATSWVVVGSVAHVLEDTGLLAPPLQYFFITPPIYLVFAAFGIGAFLIGQWLKRMAEAKGLHAALRLLWLVHVVLVLLWLGLWLKPWNQVTHYVNPLWIALFAVIDFFVARHFILRDGRVDPTQLCLTLSLGTYLLVGAYVITFIRHPWSDVGSNAIPWSAVIAPGLALATTLVVRFMPRKALLGFLLIGGSVVAGAAAVPVLARIGQGFGVAALANLSSWSAVAVALAVGLLVLVYWWGKTKAAVPATLASMQVAFATPINLLLVFSQMLDAFATSLGIDLAQYHEKHVLSRGIIDGFRSFADSLGWSFGAHYPTFFAFGFVKLVVSLLVVYAIDVYSKQDLERYPTMIGLVKFAIIMVGIGPGVRDFTRLSLGV